MKSIVVFIILSLLLVNCTIKKTEKKDIGKTEIEKKEVFKMSKSEIKSVIDILVKKYANNSKDFIKRGVEQVALLWQETDGNFESFKSLCETHYIGDKKEKEIVFNKISNYYESLYGHFSQISMDLQWGLDVDKGKVHKIDALFGGYSVGAHLGDDFYKNKIAFIVALNFPYFSLEEKTKLGADWTRKQWAYSRAGDMYTSRVPADLLQDFSKINSTAGIYISNYNIFAGYLINDKKERLFPEDMRLLSHWNLRDEIKANYGQKRGLEKQRMIYQVMKRIIDQSIPEMVINKKNSLWDPYSNKVFKDGKEIKMTPEPDTRYSHLLKNFQKLKNMDVYYPEGENTFIKRKFSGEMEIGQNEVEELFIKLLSSQQIKKVAGLIKKRVGRELEATDVWYNGFKAKTEMSAEKLDLLTQKKYPDAQALEKDLKNILIKLGFEDKKAEFIVSKIAVDPARGSGHAAGAVMKDQKSRLRTRIGKNGMNYKGYNIAVHEFGHNVEQTISIQDVDYYLMNGVPNTAFTEALAFIFQARDLEILGQKNKAQNKKHLMTLSIFWNVYESMGVSLVDMKVWKWLYKNPDTNEAKLKEAVIRISKEVWNSYFAEYLGSRDEPLLGVYSHMIGYPLYLSAYSYGYLINFQLEKFLEGKDFANEVLRMYSAGRLIPQEWMKNAVGNKISIDPLLEAVDKAIENLK